jgi:DNA polymerase III subunit epsilon
MSRKRIKHRNGIIDITQDICHNKDKYVILDTETTGLGKNDVIIQIGIIDLDGNVLMDTLIKPTIRKRMSSDATALHGITMKMLNDKPSFRELYPDFLEIVGSKTVLIYNAEYDARLIAQTAEQDGIKLKNFKALCLMKAYSIFVGAWSNYHNDYKYQKLPDGDHSAIGDCISTLKILNLMGSSEKEILPKRWFEFWKK